MTPSPHRFRSKGFQYTQISRQGKVVLLEQRSLPPASSVSYEVVIIRRQKARTTVVAGESIDFQAKETMPSSEEWGTAGWTFADIDSANRKYDRLTAQEGCSAPSGTLKF